MHSPTQSPELPYYLGCPVWACSDWVGKVFAADAKRAEYLHQYSMSFNTVEGNSTFYGLPSLETVRRWCDEALPGFHFSLKFPRAISHDKLLVGAQSETRSFLTILEMLNAADRLGPSFLQLSPSFSGDQLPSLAAYLRELPEEFPFAVEVRHSHFFDEGPYESGLNELLLRLHIDRVIFDSRALFSAPAGDEAEAEAQQRKPNSPSRQTVTGQRPMLRFVGRNDAQASRPWIKEWTPIIAGWIRDGLTPYVFMHSPNDAFAPDLAALFHAELSVHVSDLPPLPTWHAVTHGAVHVRQRELF